MFLNNCTIMQLRNSANLEDQISKKKSRKKIAQFFVYLSKCRNVKIVLIRNMFMGYSFSYFFVIPFAAPKYLFCELRK